MRRMRVEQLRHENFTISVGQKEQKHSCTVRHICCHCILGKLFSFWVSRSGSGRAAAVTKLRRRFTPRCCHSHVQHKKDSTLRHPKVNTEDGQTYLAEPAGDSFTHFLLRSRFFLWSSSSGGISWGDVARQMPCGQKCDRLRPVHRAELSRPTDAAQ